MSVTITKQVRFTGGARGRRRLEEAKPKPEVPIGRVPRISRLMALAIHMQRLIDEGVVRDYAELARLGHVSRARVTQIVNLNLLAPDLQEELLILPRVERGRDPIREHAVRAIAAVPYWRKQRRMWHGCSRSRKNLGAVTVRTVRGISRPGSASVVRWWCPTQRECHDDARHANHNHDLRRSRSVRGDRQ